ncbi:DUF4304 domain-containing protein [Sinorhizobium fredii]|nr:DUF4304 domain-containing protein [Sinorhizobium fredii]
MDCVVQVISVQRSMNNTELDSRFTVNIGVTLDTRPTKARVAEHDCRARQRIGFQRPERQDHWYRYQPKEAARVQLAVAEARAAIEAYALPYLSQTSGEFSMAVAAGNIGDASTCGGLESIRRSQAADHSPFTVKEGV